VAISGVDLGDNGLHAGGPGGNGSPSDGPGPVRPAVAEVGAPCGCNRSARAESAGGADVGAGVRGFVLALYFSTPDAGRDPAEIPSLSVHLMIVTVGLLIAAVPLAGWVGIMSNWLSGWYGHGRSAARAKPSSARLVIRVVVGGLHLVGMMVYQRMRRRLTRRRKTGGRQGLGLPLRQKEMGNSSNQRRCPPSRGTRA